MSKKGYASRNVRGKLRVCNYMLAEPGLKQYVPRTMSLNKSHLVQMIKQFRTLYIKPDVGSLGIGIFKLKSLETGYEIKEIVKKRQVSNTFQTQTAVFDYIARKKSGSMIIQQAISLDKCNGRPYDIRAMVQRSPGGSWTCSGFLVKVGAANKIVTNYYQGGEIYSLEKLFKKLGLSASECELRRSKLTNAALRIAKVLNRRRSGMHEIGIDFAFDSNQRLWVLEVNSNHPQFHPLKQIDRSAYNRMKSLAASYGRYSAK